MAKKGPGSRGGKGSRSHFYFKGFSDWTENMELVEKEFWNFLEDYMTKVILQGIVYAKKNSPVDTGELRDSWKLDKVYREGNEIVGVLRNTAEYALYVDQGHAPPYMSGLVNPGDPTWIEGLFFVRATEEQIYKYMPRLFKVEYKNLLRRLEA